MSSNRGKQRRAAKQKKRRQGRQRSRGSARTVGPGAVGETPTAPREDYRERCGYDANVDPDGAEWLAMDEDERMRRVERYHLTALPADKLPPSMQRHAGLHVSTENQLAADKPPQVRQALQRLMRQGMSRHDALHAVGSVTIAHLKRALDSRSPVDNRAYMQELEQLTLERWLASVGLG